jgi:hypothetical protein
LTSSALQRQPLLTLATSKLVPDAVNATFGSSTGLLISPSSLVQGYCSKKDGWLGNIIPSSEEHVYELDEVLALKSRALKRSWKRVDKSINAGDATVGIFESSSLTPAVVESCYRCRNRWMSARIASGFLSLPKRPRYVARLWSDRAEDADHQRTLFVLLAPPEASRLSADPERSRANEMDSSENSRNSVDVLAYLVTERVGGSTVVCVDGVHDFQLATRFVAEIRCHASCA